MKGIRAGRTLAGWFWGSGFRVYNDKQCFEHYGFKFGVCGLRFGV